MLTLLKTKIERTLSRQQCRHLLVALALGVLVIFGSGCSAESKKARHLDRANRYFESKDWEKAKIEYLNVLRLDRAHALAIERLGEVFWELGDLRQAFPFLARTKELDPDNIDVRSKLATIYLVGRQLDKAREEALAVLAKRPKDGDAVLVLAEAAQAPDQITRVQQELQTVRAQSGDTPSMQIALGALALRQGDTVAAEAAFKQAQALDPKASAPHLALARLHVSQNDMGAADREFQTAASLPDAKPVVRLQWADAKLKHGQVEQAKKILEGLSAESPEFAPASVSLAEIAFTEKRFDDAAKLISTALSRDARNLNALLLRARLKLAQNKPQEALQESEKLSKQFARSPDVWYQLALAQLMNEDVARASSSLNQSLSLQTNHTEAILLLANLDLRRGDAGNAVTSMLQFINRQPKNPRGYYVLADAYQVLGRWEDAIATYQSLHQLLPKDPQVTYRLGVLFLQRKRTADARNAFEKTIEIQPAFVPAISQLIDLDIRDKKYPAALARAQSEVQRRSASPESHMLLARVYLAQDMRDPAEVVLQKALGLDASYAPACVALAQLYVAADKNQQALEKLESVLKKNPKDIRTLFQVALIHEKTKNYPAAQEAYEKLLAVNPSFAGALNNLAYLYAEHLRQPEKGYAHALRARQLFPNDPSVADTLGWILFHRSEYPEALNLLQQSAEKLSDHSEVLYHLGMAHYMMGQEEAARSAFQRALGQDAAFASKTQAERRLAMLDVRSDPNDKKLLADLQKMVAEHPNDLIALSRLGDTYSQQGDAAKAKDAYERALKLNPKAVSALIRLAELYAGPLRNQKKAMELAKNARGLAPGDPQIAHSLGRLAFQAQDHVWAHSLLQESADRLPDQPALLYDLAMAQFSLGRVATAEQTMQRALSSPMGFSQTNAAQQFLAMTALSRSPSQAAQSESQVLRQLNKDPDYAPALMVQGIINEQRNQLSEARKVYERVLLIYPEFSPAARRLAVLYADHFSEDQKAYDLALKARAAFPDDPYLAKVLGKIVYRRNDYPSAVRLLQESSRTLTNDAEVFLCLGMAYHGAKQPNEARRALQHALALKPEPKLVQEAERILAELR